ncbi:MAG TPA: PH domain-containing protein [Flavobacterium sp.]|nr:PH domain-containing protein [Flavobacterium sp.]
MPFTNDTIDADALPRFEEVCFSSLHKNYIKAVCASTAAVLLVLAAALGVLAYFNEELQGSAFLRLLLAIAYVVFSAALFFFNIASAKRQGYALREKDILYKRGLVSTTTTIIPFNRIQHVAIHEGAVSRLFHLAQVQVFTAGGSTSDIKIPGIAKEKAESIKGLLMQKIQNNA